MYTYLSLVYFEIAAQEDKQLVVMVAVRSEFPGICFALFHSILIHGTSLLPMSPLSVLFSCILSHSILSSSRELHRVCQDRDDWPFDRMTKRLIGRPNPRLNDRLSL